MLCDGLLACSPRPFIFHVTAWREPNSPGDTTTGSLQINERLYLPEKLSVIMAVLTGRSLGEKKCMMMDWEIMQPKKKDGHERGFPKVPHYCIKSGGERAQREEEMDKVELEWMEERPTVGTEEADGTG